MHSLEVLNDSAQILANKKGETAGKLHISIWRTVLHAEEYIAEQIKLVREDKEHTHEIVRGEFYKTYDIQPRAVTPNNRMLIEAEFCEVA
jgi:hypothetical protein